MKVLNFLAIVVHFEVNLNVHKSTSLSKKFHKKLKVVGVINQAIILTRFELQIQTINHSDVDIFIIIQGLLTFFQKD